MLGQGVIKCWGKGYSSVRARGNSRAGAILGQSIARAGGILGQGQF